MALKSNNTCVAIKHQSAAGAFSNPSSPADVMPVSQLALSIAGVTIQNDEYTGSEAKNGDEISGKNATLSYRIKLRPPGGSDVPAAGAYIPGRVLVAAKMTELRTTTAIPASPEIVGVGSGPQTVNLTSGAATSGLYKGLALSITDLGSTYQKKLTLIREYDASKFAVLADLLAVPYGGNYQIPKQLSYVRSIAPGDPVYTSHRIWLDGHRYDLGDCTLSSLRFVIPASTRESAAFPEIEVTWACTIIADADESTPTVPSLGPTPKWRDGKFIMGGAAVGGSSLQVDLGLTTAYPPDPNRADGSAAAQLVESRASLSFDRWHYLKSNIDAIAQADLQAQFSVYALWGQTAGNTVMVGVPNARYNYPSPSLGGQFVTEAGDMFIDATDRAVAINFPY